MDFIILAIIGAFVASSVIIYNSLIHKRANADNAFSGIDVQLTKRHSLLSKLIEVAKQHMKFESETLQNIVKLRTQAMHATSTNDKLKIEGQLGKELSKFQITLENYPALKTSEHFIEIQRSMNEVEEQLAAARRTYNAAVTAYNVSLETFPSAFFANIFHFKAKSLFVSEETQRADIDVKSLFSA